MLDDSHTFPAVPETQKNTEPFYAHYAPTQDGEEF
jgi:hypothetical protein